MKGRINRGTTQFIKLSITLNLIAHYMLTLFKRL